MFRRSARAPSPFDANVKPPNAVRSTFDMSRRVESDGGSDWCPRTVLLVDESSRDREALARQFCALGAKVAAMSSVDEAIRSLERTPIDLVLVEPWPHPLVTV